MGLAEYCAHWFVCRGLDKPSDNEPPTDNALPEGTDKAQLASKLTAAVNHAQLRDWPNVVSIDAAKLTARADSWANRFQIATDLLNCAHSPGGADVKIARAFADYIVTRWIHRYVFQTDIDMRPIDQPLPNYGDQEKRLLAESLNESAEKCGLKVDKDAVEKARGKWKTVADVRTSYLKSVT